MDAQEERITYLETALVEEQESRSQLKRKHEVETEELTSNVRRAGANITAACTIEHTFPAIAYVTGRASLFHAVCCFHFANRIEPYVTPL